MNSCSIEGCQRPFYGKGFCRLHYIRNYRHGDPLKRLKAANGEGGFRPDGYKMVTVDGRRVREHRAIWEKAFGQIPPGFHIHHINEIPSDNRLENLQLITHAEHQRLHHLGKKRPKFSEEWIRKISEGGKRRFASLPKWKCMAFGCERKARGEIGYCSLHYQQHWKGRAIVRESERVPFHAPTL